MGDTIEESCIARFHYRGEQCKVSAIFDPVLNNEASQNEVSKKIWNIP